jgi:hypothetical protein
MFLLKGPTLVTVRRGSEVARLWHAGPKAIAAMWTQHETLLREVAARQGLTPHWGGRTRFFGELYAHPAPRPVFRYPTRPR